MNPYRLYREIRDLFSVIVRKLGLEDKVPHSLDEIEQIYESVRAHIPKGTKYRSVRVLAPPFIYMYLRAQLIPLKIHTYIDLFKMDFHEFNAQVKDVSRYYPEYRRRDRVKYLVAWTRELCEAFFEKEEAEEVLRRCEVIFKGYLPQISFTKEEVMAASLVVLAMVSLGLEEPLYSELCAYAEIEQSTLQRFIKTNILPPEGANTFKGLTKSEGLLLAGLSDKLGLDVSYAQYKLREKVLKRERKERKRLEREKISKERKAREEQKRREWEEKEREKKEKEKAKKKREAEEKESEKRQVKEEEVKGIEKEKEKREREPIELLPAVERKIIAYYLRGADAVHISEYVDVEEHLVEHIIEMFEAQELESRRPARKAVSLEVPYNPFEEYGDIEGIEATEAKCDACGQIILKLSYAEGKVVFLCRNCHFK